MQRSSQGLSPIANLADAVLFIIAEVVKFFRKRFLKVALIDSGAAPGD